MPYKTFNEQIVEHANYLQSQGLDISAEDLLVDTPKWIRCNQIGQDKGRGSCAYISNTVRLKNGLCGLHSSCRGLSGTSSFKTYGLGPDGAKESKLERGIARIHTANPQDIENLYEQAARKAYGFWQHCSPSGNSAYLERKGVGAHGIRFHASEEYGCVAVVPVVDERGKIWSYQIINNDGTKRMPKDARADGLFHLLRKPIDGELIGVAEGYATAATCMELSDIPTICSFSSENLPIVTALLLKLFPASPIIIFADNDRHLVAKGQPNIGVEKAKEAQRLALERISIAAPDFGDTPIAKDASDWNDLMRIVGKDIAEEQMRAALGRIQPR